MSQRERDERREEREREREDIQCFVDEYVIYFTSGAGFFDIFTLASHS